MSERPPEEELRELYRRLAPPPVADELDGADPETRRVVGWMQDAWRALEPPQARMPSARVAPRHMRRMALAAAAALLLVAGDALLRALVARDEPAPSRVAGATGSPPPAPAVEVLEVLPDRLELRAGPVRLVLLEPPPPRPPDEPPGS